MIFLNEILSHRPLATTSDHGLDIGFATEEKDADDGGGSGSQGDGQQYRPTCYSNVLQRSCHVRIFTIFTYLHVKCLCDMFVSFYVL